MSSKIIAIDGYASTGKSTVSKLLANLLSYIYIDTGYMYRAVSYLGFQKGIIKKGEEIDEVKLNNLLQDCTFSLQENSNTLLFNGKKYGDELRTAEISNWVSTIAAFSCVREYLLTQQRTLAKTNNVVMDGRDIGTVVFPQATLKFFFTASIEIRAKRRFDELKEKGIESDFEQIKINLLARDKQDSTRKIAPLKKAENAIEIDTSNINTDEVINLILKHYKSIL